MRYISILLPLRREIMRENLKGMCVALLVIFLAACGTTYQAKPLPFKAAGSHPNAQEVAGATLGAKAFADEKEATEAFGFDIVAAGILPVQVVFDNKGTHPLEINPTQTFLEDNEGKLWPVLSREIAYERATKYAQTKKMFKEGAYHGFLGATAGAVIGAAIGIVTGENVAAAAGKGAAIGAASGATLGGAKEYGSEEARRTIIGDLQNKSLQYKAIDPRSIAFGFIFFPAEARSAKQLRLQVLESDTGSPHVVMMNL
jgi:hypothetical protein